MAEPSQVECTEGQEMTCPFCGESGFDRYGLKGHFLNGWCEVFESVTEAERHGGSDA